jgi:Na+-translocating ferredoxin:NAD+ oxidoreductase RnfG subunit
MNNRCLWILLALPIVMVGTASVSAAKSDTPLKEKPDDLEETKFYERTYLPETKALDLQTESGDRVVETTVELTDDQIDRLQSEHRVGVFSKKYTVYKIYSSKKSDDPYRYAVPLKQPGQHEYMDLMYGVNKDGTINRIDLMIYREPHGMEIESRRFMGQFEGRTLESSEFQVNYDVIHIAGATISSKSTARGARKVLAILKMKGLTK